MSKLTSIAMIAHKPADSSRKKRKSKRPPLTCLSCFHPFTVKGAAEDCPACGARNLHVDQRTYWNQDPGIKRFEAIAKGLLVTALTVLTFFMLTTIRGLGMGQGWAIAFPLVIGWIAWDALGLLTRRDSMLNHRVLWPWLCACVGIAPGLFLLTVLVITQEYSILEELASALIWAAIWAVPAYGIHFLARRFSQIREKRMEQRISAASDENRLSTHYS